MLNYPTLCPHLLCELRFHIVQFLQDCLIISSILHVIHNSKTRTLQVAITLGTNGSGGQ